MNQKIDAILLKLSTSKFRSSFHLKEQELLYIEKKGLDKIKNHAYDFVNKRLRDITNINDGKQTPMKGHPVFVAEHATATCCRKCLEKWHHIPKDRTLTDEEVAYIVNVIMTWIKHNVPNK